jgi:hypothetical protein
MALSRERIRAWASSVGRDRAINSLREILDPVYTELMDWLNDEREKKYYSAFKDTDNNIEYKKNGAIRTVRKLNHTARSRQRKSYKRWGMPPVVSVIGTKAGEMSKITIGDLLNNTWDAETGEYKLMTTYNETQRTPVSGEIFGAATTAILEHFGDLGKLPSGFKSKFAKYMSLIRKDLERIIVKDGF